MEIKVELNTKPKDIKATKKHGYPASISLVITNNKNAKGINVAKKYSVPIKVFDKKKFDKINFEKNSIKVLLSYKIELICLCRYYLKKL